jgi:diguanylate cyclase
MAIKYQQSKEDSIALLRLVIAQMGQHDAPFDPVTFAVWYEHLAGINPALSRAVERALQARPRLGADEIAQLHRDHVAEADAAATEAASDEIQRVMRRVADSAAETGESARVYRGQLAGLSRALEAGDGSPDPAALAPRLSEVASGTSTMETAVVALQRSVDESRQEIEQLRQALVRSRVEAITDALSGLRNRKGFDEALRDTLASAPPAGLTHCLVVIDIDHFKRVNDTYGHPVGDSVIESLGKVLGRVAAGGGHLAARIGGEEFAVLMRATTKAQALQLAEAARALASAMKIRRRGTQEVIAGVTVSGGIAAWAPGDDAASLLAAADAALYRAKAAGRDRVFVA